MSQYQKKGNKLSVPYDDHTASQIFCYTIKRTLGKEVPCMGNVKLFPLLKFQMFENCTRNGSVYIKF